MYVDIFVYMLCICFFIYNQLVYTIIVYRKRKREFNCNNFETQRFCCCCFLSSVSLLFVRREKRKHGIYIYIYKLINLLLNLKLKRQKRLHRHSLILLKSNPRRVKVNSCPTQNHWIQYFPLL